MVHVAFRLSHLLIGTHCRCVVDADRVSDLRPAHPAPLPQQVADTAPRLGDVPRPIARWRQFVQAKFPERCRDNSPHHKAVHARASVTRTFLPRCGVSHFVIRPSSKLR